MPFARRHSGCSTPSATGRPTTAPTGADPDAVRRRIDELGDRVDTISVIDDQPYEK
jgi:hypothetical protein